MTPSEIAAILARLAELENVVLAGTSQWSQAFGYTGTDVGLSVAVDSASNVLVTGSFNGAVDFGGGLLSAPSVNPEMFIVKFDASGNHVWSQRFGAGGVDQGLSIVVDSTDNVLVTGSIEGTVDFGGGPLAALGDTDMFVVKFDASGAHQWSQRFGDASNDAAGHSVAVDSANNVVVTGSFEGTVDFGGGPLTTAGVIPGFSRDIVLVKFDATGAHQWSQHFGNNNSDVGDHVVVDHADNVVVTVRVVGAVDFGGGLPFGGGTARFVVKYDSSGAYQWEKGFGASSTSEEGFSVAVDSANNLLMTGFFNGSINLGGGSLSSAGGTDIFVTKFDASGVHQWSLQFGSTSSDEGHGIAVDSANNVLVTGFFSGTVDFGGGALLTSAGNRDVFVAKYDMSGSHQWAQRIGGGNFDKGHHIAVDSSGQSVVTGSFQATMFVGGNPLTSAGAEDIFIAQFAP